MSIWTQKYDRGESTLRLELSFLILWSVLLPVNLVSGNMFSAGFSLGFLLLTAADMIGGFLKLRKRRSHE